MPASERPAAAASLRADLARTPAEPWQITAVHQRAVVGAILMLLFAVVLHRADLVVYASPLLLVAVWGWAAQPRGRPVVAVTAPAGDLVEGLTVSLPVDVHRMDGVDTIGVDLGVPADLRIRPGALAAPVDGEAWAGSFHIQPTHMGALQVGTGETHLRSAWGAYDARWRRDRPIGVVVAPTPGVFDADAPVPHPSTLLGTHVSRRRGDGAEFDAIREFRPGDRPRHVHWPTSARTRRLHVRTTHPENDTQVVLLVDAFGDLPGEPDGSLTRTLRAAASVAAWCTRTGDRVGLRVLGAASAPVVAGSGRHQLLRILGTLARITPGDERVPDSRHLELHLPPGTLLVIVSPLTEPAVAAAAAQQARRGLDVVVIDTTPDEVVSADAAERTAWLLLQLERDQVVSRLRGRGVAVTPWRGPGTLDAVLAGLARRRAGAR